MTETEIIQKCNLQNYLVLMDFVKAGDFRVMHNAFSEKHKRRVTDILYDDLISNGTMVMVEEREIYSKIYSFDRYKDCKFDYSFGVEIDEIDFAKMLNKDIWGYIYGEYFINYRLIIETTGFGLMKI